MAEQAKSRVILVAIDGSHQAEHALRWYHQILHHPENQVFLVHIPEGPTLTGSEGQRLNHGEIKQIQDIEKKETEALQKKYSAILEEIQMPAQYITVYGKPGEAMVKTAQEKGANMVVMGTRGLGTIRRTILGSVSDYVVHHAPCPVVVCRHR